MGSLSLGEADFSVRLRIQDDKVSIVIEYESVKISIVSVPCIPFHSPKPAKTRARRIPGQHETNGGRVRVEADREDFQQSNPFTTEYAECFTYLENIQIPVFHLGSLLGLVHLSRN